MARLSVPSPRVVLVRLAACLALSGCSWQTAAGVGDGLAIVTDADAYVAVPTERIWDFYQHDFRVVARTTNRTNATLYLQRCRPESTIPMYDVAFADTSMDRRRAAYSLAWACVGHDRHIELLPGAVRVDTLLLHGPNMWDGRTHAPIGEIEGAFRLSYRVSRCRSDGGCELPDTVWYSNVFQVRRRSP